MNSAAKSKFDTFTNVLLVIVVVAVSIQFFGPQLFRKKPLGLGDALPVVSGYSWTEGPTLVLALKEECPFCEASMPFYRRLVALRDEGRLKTKLLAVFPGKGSTGSDLLRTNSVSIPAISNVDMTRLKVQGTPTLVLVNPQGRVTSIWLGQLSSAGEDEVIRAAQVANSGS